MGQMEKGARARRPSSVVYGGGSAMMHSAAAPAPLNRLPLRFSKLSLKNNGPSYTGRTEIYTVERAVENSC
ncbi:hypothetical protein GWI33_008398 [Rhynchophorus ferrugineus]|uniref:Uncharacterized protein n=1 Tax=Rhynchophorus ferrugineus TaxID=354439 RepID=A0A834IG96_RHYFE|nr:hypothetical protein GWI33_008398 [Rhynchophorus ferrugineus]